MPGKGYGVRPNRFTWSEADSIGHANHMYGGYGKSGAKQSQRTKPKIF